MKCINALMLTVTVFLVCTSYSLGQMQSQGCTAIVSYMQKKNTKYQPESFGEVFEQNQSSYIQKALKTKRKVKYSVSHTYNLGGPSIQEYFHLDKNFKVIGKMDMNEMMNVTWAWLMQNKEFALTMDSMQMDTSKVRFKEVK